MARRRKNSSVTIAREDLAAVNGVHGGSSGVGGSALAGGNGQINAGLVGCMVLSLFAVVLERVDCKDI